AACARRKNLHAARIREGAVALVAAEARRHQQHGRPDPFPAAGLDVLPDLRNQLDPRLHVPRKLLVHLLQVGADRLEDLRQGWRRFFHSVCWSELYHGLNTVWKFAAVRAARSAGGIPYTRASVSTTRATYAGSFRLPRYGTGARNGLSVSVSNRSSGTRRDVARSSSAFGKVMIPAIETKKPSARPASASDGPPVKQCSTPRTSPPPSSRSTAIVSSSASRVWTTTGSDSSRARRTCPRKTNCWTSRGEKS